MPEPYFALVGPYPRKFPDRVDGANDWQEALAVAQEMEACDRSATAEYYKANPLPLSPDALQRRALAKRTSERPHRKGTCPRCFQHRSLGGACFCTDSDLDRSGR